MSSQYPWAANFTKLQRALQACPGTEEQVKEYYIKLGGLVINAPEEPVPDPTIPVPPEPMPAPAPEPPVAPVIELKAEPIKVEVKTEDMKIKKTKKAVKVVKKSKKK